MKTIELNEQQVEFLKETLEELTTEEFMNPFKSKTLSRIAQGILDKLNQENNG